MHNAYQRLANAGLVSKVTVHRYQCGKCSKVLSYRFRLGDTTIARTVDCKYSPGLNLRQSVAAARERNTLDGERHWPGHTYDVDKLANCGPQANFDVACRHVTATLCWPLMSSP